MVKKICFLTPGYVTKHIGGSELQIYLLSEELLERGWQVEIVTQGRKKNNYHSSLYYNRRIRYHYYSPRPLLSIDFLCIFLTLLKTRSYYYYNRTDARFLRKACAVYCKIFKKKMIYALAGDGETRINTYYERYKKAGWVDYSVSG